MTSQVQLLNQEVLHTSHIVRDMWDNHIEQHEVVTNNPELAAKAAEVGAKLDEFYQMVGAVQATSE